MKQTEKVPGGINGGILHKGQGGRLQMCKITREGRQFFFKKEKAPLRVGETGGQHVNLLAITN